MRHAFPFAPFNRLSALSWFLIFAFATAVFFWVTFFAVISGDALCAAGASMTFMAALILTARTVKWWW